jgi:hypothetical protein
MLSIVVLAGRFDAAIPFDPGIARGWKRAQHCAGGFALPYTWRIRSRGRISCGAGGLNGSR